MAVYVHIRKQKEHDTYVEYSFGASEESSGLLRMDRSSGETTLVSPADNDQDDMAFMRASRKLKQHWMRGELPDVTCWAS